MAITGAAAIAGVAAGAAGVSTTIIAVAGLAITAVGMITKNQTLMKIGGGIGLGGAASGLAASATSAGAGATDAATAGMNAPSVADAAGAGSQAAGNVAEASTAAATSTPADLISGYTGAGAADSGGLIGGAAAQTSTDAAISGAQGVTGNVAPVDAALNGAANNSIDASLTAQSPAQQAIQNGVSAPVNTNVANVNPANTNSIASNTAAASPVAPGSQAAGGATATTGSGAPYAFDSAGAYTPVQNGLQAPSSWWSDLGSWFKDPNNNGLMQLGGGLVKGVGQGIGAVYSADAAKQMTDQQKWEQANMSGAGSVPNVGFSPSGAPSPYASPQKVQQQAVAGSQPVQNGQIVSQPASTTTTTPQYNSGGIVNKQRSK